MYQSCIEEQQILASLTKQLIDDLNTCEDENYVSSGQVTEQKQEAYILLKKLNGFIKYLKKCKDNTSNQ